MTPSFFTNALWLDNVSVSSSVPSLEPCSPSTASQASSAGPDTPPQLSDIDDDIVIITDRNKFDTQAAGNRLHESGQFTFMLNVCPTSDCAARLFLQFHIADVEARNAQSQTHSQDTSIRTFRINWRWVRGVVYTDDRVFWPASRADINQNFVPGGEKNFSYELSGTFTRCALDLHDLSGAGEQPPRDCPHTNAAQTSPPPPAKSSPPAAASGALPLPFHAVGVAISVAFSSGAQALRRFYHGANQERVTLTANWLSTDKLLEFASIPLQNERTPAWVKAHCSDWIVKEVITCNGGNLCGIDYKLRLIDNEVIWLRDDCLEWVTGALEAVRAFWAAGHCLRPDIAEKFLHQRPNQYCTLEWDAALLEWATRKVQSGHAYRIINGRVRSAM